MRKIAGQKPNPTRADSAANGPAEIAELVDVCPNPWVSRPEAWRR